MGKPEVAVDKYDDRMNKWDKELKEFMMAAEKKCRTYKNVQIEWSPTIIMWLRRRWILDRVKKSIAKTKAWSMCRQINV